MLDCDVIVIGAGPGGYVAAIRAAQLGAKVVVIERAELGGVCLNWGCIPTKTLIHSGETYRRLKGGKTHGISAADVTLDLPGLLKHKNDVVRKNKAGIASLFKGHGIEAVQGSASVEGPGTVMVDGRSLRSRSIIVATGSRPARIPGLETNGKTVIGSTDALELDHVPSRIAVIGAGAIGSEFACLWNNFGASVTLIEKMPSVLPLDDVELTDRLAKHWKKSGIDVRSGTTVKTMKVGKKGVTLELEGKSPGTVEVDVVLVGIGIAFNSEAAGNSGVALGDRGQILVNDRMETSIPGIFAIGDVTGKTLLAHGASAEAMVAAENSAGKNRTMNYRVVPACTFTSPEIARVGLTEAQAREAGIEVRVGRFNFAASGRALAMDETDGMVKLIGDARTDQLIGAHILGAEAGELIAVPALAMQMEATVEDVAHTIHTHPTLSETLLEASEDYYGRSIHTPPKRR